MKSSRPFLFANADLSTALAISHSANYSRSSSEQVFPDQSTSFFVWQAHYLSYLVILPTFEGPNYLT